MLSSPVMKWTGAVLLIASLVATHWWAYRQGVKAEHDRIADFAVQLFNTREMEAFQQHVEFLRILAKHPQAINVEDVKSYCDMTLSLAISIEKSEIIPARKAGDDPKADKLQQRIDEARRLVALLTK